MMRVPYASQAAVEFADRSMEAVCYHAYWASSLLAEERGRYQSYEGSLWSRGILPQDTLKMLRDERGGHVEVDESSTLDWDALRARIKQPWHAQLQLHRNRPNRDYFQYHWCICVHRTHFPELVRQIESLRRVTVVNDYLVRDLKKLGLWDEVMVADLKYFDGSLSRIDRVPSELRELYATAFEVEPSWLVECASRRQKWIDQAQSLNIYMAGASGKKLDDTLQAGLEAWPEDDLLPAYPWRHQRREVDGTRRRTERRQRRWPVHRGSRVRCTVLPETRSSRGGLHHAAGRPRLRRVRSLPITASENES